MNVKVLKFGGSILKDREDFGLVADLIAKELKGGILPLTVVSAMKGVTDRIIDAVEMVLYEDEFDLSFFIEDLLGDYIGVLPEGVEATQALRDEFKKLEHTLGYIGSSGELNDSAYAFAVSRGENFSCHILAEHLKARGVESRLFAGEELLITNENYRDALVNLERTRENVRVKLGKVIEGSAVPIVAGFSGRSESGRISILGRGGTDDTAVCLAYCLGAKAVVKYVDQKGVMTIDPGFLEEINRSPVNGMLGVLPEPEVISYLSYVEASELMREERIKVVHYKVLNPLILGDIRFHVKDIADPEARGTVIGPEDGNGNGAWTGRPKAISFQRNLWGIRFLPTQSRTPTEVYARVFEALARVGVDVRYISISGYQISLLMPEDHVGAAMEALGSLEVAVNVSALEGRKGTFSIVGSGMKGVRGFLSRVTSVIAKAGVNIEQATQPYSENIIRFSVDDEDLPLAVGAVYSEFFG
jgi:aspartate kinase